MQALGFGLTTLSRQRSSSAFPLGTLSGLRAWYDPSDISSLFQDSSMTVPVTADGDPVGAMLDKSGNGNHMLQSDADSRPTYKASGGLHWIEGDGVDDLMLAPPMISDYDFTMVAAVDSIGSSRGIATLNTDGGRYWSLQTDTVGADTTYQAADRQGYGVIYFTSQTVVTAPAVVLGEWQSGQVSISVDDSSYSSAATSGTVGAATNLRLFSFRDGSNTSGSIHGITVFDRILDSSERSALADWFATKQGRSL